jgi:hypothetical protein
MNLKLGFASLSLGASVDQQTGHLSVFDVIEEIRTHQLPIQMQSLVITLALIKNQKTEANGKVMIHFLTPDGQQALVGNGEMQIPAEQRRMKAVFRFGGFPIQQYGEHRLVVSWLDDGGTKKGEAILDFDVVQVTQVAQGMGPAEKPPISH